MESRIEEILTSAIEGTTYSEEPQSRIEALLLKLTAGGISPTEVSKMITEALADYYEKSETYSKEETNDMISRIPKFGIEVVDELPTKDISETTVYLKVGGSQSRNLYDEYIYVKGEWELLGSAKIDLTNYYSKEETDEKLDDKVDKESGKGLSSNDYTTDEKTKLSGIEEGANKYTLPAATSNALGGVKVDTALSETSTNPVQNKAATTELNNIKAKTINGVALSSGQNLIVPRSSKSLLSTAAGIGKNGYIKFATLTVTGRYADHPHYIRLHIRNMSFTLVISGEGKDEIDVTFNKVIVTRDFTSTGTVFIYYKKVTNAVVDFYFLKRQNYDTLFVEDYIHADAYEGDGDKLEFKSEFTTTLPEGAVLIPTKADPDEIADNVAKIKTSLNTTSTNLTLGSDVSAGKITAKRVGNIINIIGTGIKPLISNTGCTLATLDTAFRPSTMNVTGWCSFDSGSIASETFVQVATNGTISINRRNAGLDTSLGYSFNITYII